MKIQVFLILVSSKILSYCIDIVKVNHVHSSGDYRIGTATGPWTFLKDDDVERNIDIDS